MASDRNKPSRLKKNKNSHHFLSAPARSCFHAHTTATHSGTPTTTWHPHPHHPLSTHRARARSNLALKHDLCARQVKSIVQPAAARKQGHDSRAVVRGRISWRGGGRHVRRAGFGRRALHCGGGWESDCGAVFRFFSQLASPASFLSVSCLIPFPQPAWDPLAAATRKRRDRRPPAAAVGVRRPAAGGGGRDEVSCIGC